MNRFLVIFSALIVGLVLAVPYADGARMGGGRSSGIQRHYTPPPARQATPPTRQQPPAAAPAQGASRWPSVLGGLALGGLLGSMFGGDGFGGGGFGALLLLMVLVIGGVLLVRAVLHRPQAPPRQELEERRL
jgi:predicted lipid-binding transport protein (Tim44 family)